ncbi:SIMPL domain-containing protein [Halorarius halobius]|uniref:SIMPL domain-containing protein n=1 Tax=Halorarius halobius TaxID=2962671 RepID=UPI0020CBE19B|nr:SIMPL domain-containing protein [Halorarius halobius]
MRRNSTIIVLAVAALAVGAGVTAAVGGLSPAAQASTEVPTTDGARTITVGAGGTAETTPDQAVVTVAVVTTADSASAARQELADNVSRMRDALRDADVSEDQVRTQRYDISQNYEARDDPTAPAYRAMHAFQITVRDVDNVGTVIDTAVENGATNVDDVRFTLSSETRRDLRKEALSDAMDNARGQADTLAQSSDLTITGVGAVSTVERGYSPVRYETAAMSADAGGTSVESGPVSVSVQVQVTYNATDN